MLQGIKLTKNSIIYIFAPKGYASGGPTLLHQLASAIIKKCNKDSDGVGVIPQMVYFDINATRPSYDPYSCYHIKATNEINDEEQNVIISAETATPLLANFSKIQKVIWWLSVDAFVISLVKSYTKYYNDGDFSVPIPKEFSFTSNEPITHFVQSYYALNFLLLNGVPKNRIFWLSDYLHPVFLKKANQIDIAGKERIVAYNPKKGSEFTQKIITFASEINSNINFYPIKNMTPEEVENLLARAMVYIDFGHHPGKDRIPREAAISGCVVITGKRGAAANYEDVPIDAEFKFNDNEAEIPNIIKKITEVFDDFPKYHAKFEHYREIILQEPEKFENDAVKALNLPNDRTKEFVAILQTGARERVLRDFISNNKDLELVFIVDEDNSEGGRNSEYISLDDAIFLYQEKRIEKFAAVTISDAEKAKFIKELTALGIKEDDLIFIDVRR